MPWPTYSERFLQATTGGTHTFTVPPGQRAVVTNIDGLSQLAGQSWCSLQVAAAFATLILFPAPNQAVHETMRIVAYAGELMSLTISETGLHVSVNGYLFEDPPGARAALAVETSDAVAPWWISK